jgi:hypothetical protein
MRHPHSQFTFSLFSSAPRASSTVPSVGTVASQAHSPTAIVEPDNQVSMVSLKKLYSYTVSSSAYTCQGDGKRTV